MTNLQLSAEELLEIYSGTVPESVRVKLEPLVHKELDGTFGNPTIDQSLTGMLLDVAEKVRRDSAVVVGANVTTDYSCHGLVTYDFSVRVGW